MGSSLVYRTQVKSLINDLQTSSKLANRPWADFGCKICSGPSITRSRMNLNLSASLNVTRLLFNPGLCLPHCTVLTFNDLPVPLDKGLQRAGHKSDIRAVVLDKDDCFAYPDTQEVYEPYKVSGFWPEDVGGGFER